MDISSIPIPARTFSRVTWQKMYESAILEPDNSKLLQRIMEARHAILDRAEEILTSPSNDERHALNGALKTLRILESVVERRQSAA